MEFLEQNAEDAKHNQYWYSPYTIQCILDDLILFGGSVAFLSTPSLYFSAPDSIRQHSKVFDFDRKWESDPGFIFYDFNNPEEIPVSLHGSFDTVVIDPPFITEEVWAKYAITANLLMKTAALAAHPVVSTGSVDGPSLTNAPSRVILTTIQENADLLKRLLGASPQVFQPSIPHLVYQYSLYTNYESETFSKKNPEIPD